MKAHRRRSRRRILASALCLLAPCIIAACGKVAPSDGGLMLIVSSDGPLGLTRLDVRIEQNGRVLLSNTYRVPEDAKLPATIAIVSKGDLAGWQQPMTIATLWNINPMADVRLAITGWEDSERRVPLDRRDVIVTELPSDRVARLAIVLSALCTDKVTVNKDGNAQSTCDEGATCNDAGQCSSGTVMATDLPSYRSGDENDAGYRTATGGNGGNNDGIGGSGQGAAGSSGEAEPAGQGGEAGGATVDACFGKQCFSPPASDCRSATQLIAYDAVGSCSTGVCSYESHTISCTCQAHACVADPCASVSCDSPPAATCKDRYTRTTYASKGTCSDGNCRYAATNMLCSFGCSGGACNVSR